ncbi:hypothetical protein, partial [Bartonella sp. AC53GZZY]|uniref:hypothetical protein n=2 Tax=unclassified Bartonella TaxID=2645622 RepID=UPI0035D0A421
MKKLYAIKLSRFSFVQILSLAVAVTFVSNITSVFSANPDFRNTFVEGLKSPGVSYPKSIVFVAGLNDSDDYANFLVKTLSDVSDYSSVVNVLESNSSIAWKGVSSIFKAENVSDKKAQQFTRSIHMNSIDGVDFSNSPGLLRTVSTQRAAAKGNGHPLEQGYSASAKGYDAIALGPLAEAKQDRSIAIGLSSYANAHNSIAIGSAPDYATEEQRTTAGDEKAIAIGFQARAFGKFTIALGDSAGTTREDAVAIGHHAKVDIHQGVAIGANSLVSLDGGVAIGSNSVADRAADILGYASLQQGPAVNTEVQWKSTQGAVSVGNPSKGITRQIIGVAAGSEPTDAVNVIQLKDLESVVRNDGWKLSVGGKNGKTVIMDSTVDFSAGSANLQVTKGDKDNNVKFDLAKEIAVNKITAGSSTLDATGLVIANGPKITTGGIDVGSKKITGVATGTESTDAVNFGQLKEIKEQVATSSFVKQDAQTKFITIGKDTDGDKITIANKDNKTRILSGVASGTNDTDAVNVAQLKALKNSITSSWDLSVEGADTTSVNSTSPMDLAAGSSNLNITKGKEDNKVKFDLAKDITLESVKAGTNTLDETGLVITGGPKITTSGIDAGNKELKGVKDGALSVGSTEAVNGSQLLATNNEIADVRDSILVKQEEGMALSRSLRAEGSGVITIGKGTGGTEISILNKDNGARKISGLLGGDLSANSDEAVTGSQLFTTNQNVTTVTSDLKTVSENIAKYFGGGAKYENGAWTAPKFTVKSVKDDGETENKEYPDVADALAGVGSSITNVQNKLTEQVKDVIIKVESESFVQQDKTTSRLTIGAKVGGTEINIANESGADRIISGVGEAKNNNDAVNKSQLDSNIKNVNDNVTNKFSELTKNITNITQQVKGDALLWNDKANAFVARHEKSKEEKGRAVRTQDNSKITFLLDGDVSKDSTDAVTGGQLYSLNEQLATYFGGGAGYDEQGKWTAPSFKVKTVKDDGKSEEKTYSNVADALAGVGTSVTNVKNEISKEITNVVSESLVKQDNETAPITVGKETNGTVINVANKSGVKRVISGVKDAEQDNDAVNKGQLDASLKELATSLQSEDSAVVHYDKKEGDNGGIDYTSVTLGKGKDKAAVGLHNVADGQIAKGSHDAITGGQINKIGEDVAKFLGGEASFKDGALTQPRYKLSHISEDGQVSTSAFDGVGGAFEGLDDNIKNVNQRIKEVSEGVAQDSLNWSNEANAFLAKHGTEGSNSKITFLANGEISAKSTDAVTGNQLYSMNQTFATYFGGGAGYNEKGEWVAPTFKLKTVNSDGSAGEEKVYNSVSEAFAGVASSITNVHNDVTNVVSDSLIKQDDDTKVITIGKEVAGTEISLLDEKGKERTLSGIKAAENDNEAVNKAQLDASLKDLSISLQSDDSAVVHYDKLADGKTDYSSVTLGKGKDAGLVALHNIADGTIAENSHDAINGSQINTISQDVAKFLGGDAAFKDGSFTNPTYKLSHVSEEGKVTDGSYNDVGSAFTGLDKNIKNVNQRIKEVSESVAQDSLNWSEADSAFVAMHGEGKGKSNSKLKFLLDGDVLKGSTEAITGNQLYSMGSALATYFGGGAKYEKGEWFAPTFKLKTVNGDGTEIEKSYQSIADAFAGIASSITNVHNDVTNVVSDSLVKQDNETAPITVGKETSGTEINIANKDQADRTLSGVKAATKNNEAVNKGQLDESLKELSNNLQSEDSIVVHYDKKEKGETDYTNITLGKGKDSSPVSLHNVADGKIIKDSHDVITGGQINKIGEDIAKFLGGESSFKDGALTQPTYKLSEVSEEGKVKDKSYTGVGTAFSGLDENIKHVNQRIKEVSEGVAQDSLNWSSAEGAFLAQHGEKKGTKTNSKIKFLANGEVSESSTEAITGNQLYSMSNTLAIYLGGGAGYENGQWKAPNFVIKKVDAAGKESEKSYNSVAEALSDISTSVTNVHNDVTTVVSDSLVKQDEDTKVIKIGAEKEGAEISFTNSKNELRILSGVAAATKNNEAVNKGQLDESLEKLSNSFQSDDSAVVHYDKEEGDNSAINYTSVTLGGKDKKPVGLHNIADGVISESSHDAVNGGQINTISKNVTKFLGGNATFNNGVFTNPTYSLSEIDKDGKITDKPFTDVGSAFEGLDTNIKNVNTRIKEVSEGVAQDSLLWNKEANAFVARHEKRKEEKDGTVATPENSKITFLANGDITATSSDAIAGNQLHSFGSSVASYFGGNASYTEGKWTAPSFTIKKFDTEGTETEEKYDNVAAAFTGVNNSITNIHNEINKEIGKVVSDSLVKQDKEGDPITIGKETGGTIINLQNKNNENRTISGVIGGTISKDSIEAINGSQLFETNEKVASYFGGGAKYEEGQWTAPTFTVKTVKDGGSDVEDKEYKTVAEALAGVGASITNVRKEINNEITNVVSDSLVKWDEDKQLIKIGAEKYGNKITISDNDGKNRTLSGVKDAEQDNDAVNKGQLDASLKELSNNLQSEDSAVVHYDKKEKGETDYTNITLGKGKDSTSVGLHNVADGNIAENSHDAITGGQINKIGEDIAKFLGGASSFKDGALTVPTYEISNISDKGEVTSNSYNDVGSAFAGLDKNFKNVNNNLTNKFNELTQNITNITQEVQGDALLWDKTKGAFVATHGDNKENSKLTSLKNGDITAASSDAIAGNQLYALGDSVAKTLGGNASYENGTWTSPTFKFKSVSEDGTKVEDKDYSTIAEAFAGVGLSFENLQKEFTQSNTEVTDNIKQNALLWSDEDSAYVALHGQGDKRSKSKLKLLLDGDISEGSSEAITGN